MTSPRFPRSARRERSSASSDLARRAGRLRPARSPGKGAAVPRRHRRLAARLDVDHHLGAVDLGTVRALYHRRPSVYQAPQQLDDQQRRFTAAQVRHGLSGLLAALPDCLYVNHPHHNWNAEYKPRQITTAVAAGLDVPPTLVTNDPGTARAFAEEHGPVVYKPLLATDYREDGEPRTV